MSRITSPAGRFSDVETLEARIAPAVILVGSPGSGSDTDYNEAPFVNTEANPADPISAAVGPGEVGMADTFYLRLSKGDTVKLFNTTNGFEDFIIVKSGNAIAFFTDDTAGGAGQTNEVSAQEFVGLSLGKGASVEVRGSIFGDVVTNLNENGTADKGDDTLQMTGLVSAKQNIASLVVGANVSGGLYSGGTIANVDIRGNVQEILTGTAANVTNKAGGFTYDFFPGVVGGEGILAVTADAGIAGSSISKVRVNSVTNMIGAGDGGAGAKGGSLSNIQITQDSDGMTIEAGAGGNGAGSKTNGGAGGDLTSIFVAGIPDNSANSPAGIHIRAGDAGDGTGNGKGGAGGKATSIFVGYELNQTSSGVPLKDSVEVRSGIGGDGTTGGVGGAINNVNVTVNTAEAAGNEIEVIAGAGGGATTGKAGAGGAVAKLNLQNQDAQLFSDVEVRAGNAGTVVGTGTGAAGGAISTVTILGSEVIIAAGNGSNGKSGGGGGSVSGISFVQRDTIVTNNLQLSAGFGGNGTAGNGGNGGNVSGIKNASGDFTLLQINGPIAGGTGANGGIGTNGKGGNGGTVTNLDLVDIDFGNAFSGPFTLRSGVGGDGDKGGGNGGLVDKVILTSLNLEPTVIAGNGGAAKVTGVGGKGATVSNLNIFADGEVNGVLVSGTVLAGTGGAGQAANTKGGVGGDLKTVNLNADLNVTIMAGDGGSGGAQTVLGKGGSVLNSAAFGTAGFGVLAAGDAGAGGIKAAAGGSITGSGANLISLRGLTDLTITAGNGSHGGAGGAIKGLTFGSSADSLSPTPIGNVLVQAGNGSAEGSAAGAGGSIDLVQGNPSSGTNATTRIVAGNGGGTATSTKSGAGGSVSNFTLSGFGDDFIGGNAVVLTIEAGNGGVAPGASTGGNGGGVKNVAINELDTDLIFRSVAAGDGANGTGKGGTGGTIDGVYVGATLANGVPVAGDIGVRQGEMYGYTTMGGVFAGAGGTGGKAGLAGSVRNISAESIAAIVAGKGAVPQLVEKVERITIGVFSGANLLLDSEQDLAATDEPGAADDPNYRAFNAASFFTNNLVGAVFDPSSVDGNKFKFNNLDGTVDGNGFATFTAGDTPIDGLIAAKVFITNFPTNFVPEALLTAAEFFDYNNSRP